MSKVACVEYRIDQNDFHDPRAYDHHVHRAIEELRRNVPNDANIISVTHQFRQEATMFAVTLQIRCLFEENSRYQIQPVHLGNPFKHNPLWGNASI